MVTTPVQAQVGGNASPTGVGSLDSNFEDESGTLPLFGQPGLFMLNPHFVIALLNDVYGIQVSGWWEQRYPAKGPNKPSQY